jgi:hypothetical protein
MSGAHRAIWERRRRGESPMPRSSRSA